MSPDSGKAARVPARHATLRPEPPRGRAATGRVVKLFTGQGHGFIRMADGREVFFHRADLKEGSSINDFAVGDAVGFELLDDRLSGARALDVRLKRSRS